MRSGCVYRRQTLAPPIGASGCSSSVTPTVSSSKHTPSDSECTEVSRGKSGFDALGYWWPTPCASDARDSARHTVREGAASHSGTSLTDKMRLWCSHHGLATTKPGLGGGEKPVLSPPFVELLMGLPVGYTLVDDADAYDALVAGLCPGRQLRLF